MSEVRSILLRLPNWLGDSVMCSSALNYLKSTYPNASFSLVGTNASCGIYERDCRINKIFIDKTKSAKSRLLATFYFAREIGMHDIAISFSNSFFSALLLFFTHSPLRLGYGKNARSFLLTHSPKIPKSPKNTPKIHQVILYLRLICSLKAVYQHGRAQFFDKNPTSENLATLLGNLPLQLYTSPLNLSKSIRKIGINPGAAFGSAKRWEQSYFIEVISYFLEQKYEVYLFGVNAESSANAHISTSISEIFQSSPHILKRFINLTDKTSINALIDYIAAMSVFITNDSGPMHIAAAVQTPIVAIFGPTDKDETAPFKAQNAILLSASLPCAPCKKRECPLKHHECMKLITPKEVINATNTLISKANIESADSIKSTQSLMETKNAH